MTVAAELIDFEENLRNVLDYHLIVVPNWAYWEEFDTPSYEFFEGLDDAFIHLHQPLITKYKGTAVEPIVKNLCEMLRITTRIGMNVPFPRYPELHAQAVADNIMTVYTETIYVQLCTEMTMINHFASYIQRIWKRANTNPSHPICRNRLSREFADLEQSVC